MSHELDCQQCHPTLSEFVAKLVAATGGASRARVYHLQTNSRSNSINSTMGQGCTTCSRVMLIIINFLLMALGLALIAALIWLRLDEHIEQSIRISFMDTNPNPYEMYEIKQGIRTVFTIGYWVVLGFGIALSIIGFIGMCGSIALSKTANGFYITALILLLILEIAVVVFVIFYRNQIQERIQRYLTVAFQYNLQDALTISQRFNCCGDGSPNSYNYQCQQMGQPNCRDIIGERLGFLSLAAGIVAVVVIGIQILTILTSLLAILKN
ncbi:tetraspanin family domain-containing protein [Ditylenchus destructor]|uniref:Tetraspanin family domain-containing protein n=1 Tax=Ditylenchus destructor TaxID=166010 RepID=A0AAD4N2K4_9BILA|nr:tetraspanin family domain-containing protein [Ditylenchus destructor]